MILTPPYPPVTQCAARLIAGQHGVITYLPEMNEKFRQMVKKMSYRWDAYDRRWHRSLDECSGPVSDRLLETAASLASAGFIIDLSDELAVRLQAGEWQPEHKRWVIVVGKQFGLRWHGENESLYRKALTLPGGHWDADSKSVVVQAMYYNEVQGFADEHEFRLASGVKELMENAEREYSRTILPVVPPPVVVPQKKKRQRRSCDPAQFLDFPGRSVKTLTDLLPHQRPAVEKLFPMRVGAFFMDMGTGKTRCAIELAARRQQRTSKVVWFCPVSLKMTIAAEIAKHTTGESCFVFDDTTDSQNLPQAFWYVVGIESMSSSDRVVLAVDKIVDGDTFAVVDESSYIKGHASLRSMRIAEICKRARYRLLLTGTPISQGVEDLYAQMRFLSPDILGYSSFYSFARNHLEYSEKFPGMIVRSHGVDNLADKIAPYIYQVTKADCSIDLPEKLYDQVFCNLTEQQRDAYYQAKSEILLEAEELTSYTIFRLFTALQQIVSGFWNREGQLIEFPQARIAQLERVVDAIPGDEKIIVWCKFIYSIQKIAAQFPGCALYYGDLSESERAEQLEKFRSKDCRILIATQATGGHGLTLNEARYHVFYENEFKYSHRIQAEDRSHRIGQDRQVTYIDIVSDSGIDRRIQDALKRKEDVVKKFRREVSNVSRKEIEI